MRLTPLFLLSSLSSFAIAGDLLVIAHRGASGYVPEHTLEAVAMAHAMGADFIEQDVVLSKDNVPVVLHDKHIDTVTDVALRFPDRKRDDGRWYALDFTLAELKSLRVNERVDVKTGKQVFPKRFPGGATSRLQIPTLEEELDFIAGLNHSTGHVAGVYPEIKAPAWHRKEGHDISAIVLPILRKHGYATKQDACYLQCFELAEVKRIRSELWWQGRLVFLMGGGAKSDEGDDLVRIRSREGLAEIAKIADGIGPAVSSIVAGKTRAERKITTLVADAHAAGLVVHPYTLRVDELPKWVESADELMRLLFDEAKVDGLFTDFPDVTVRWLRARR